MNDKFYVPFKKLVLIIALTISASVFLSVPVRSQPNDIYSDASLSEKIYLQLDGKVYTTDKTIWFKTIVTNAINHAPTILSGVLYVELIGPDEKIVEKKLVKIKNGIGDGFFELNQRYPEGLYLVRAYTEWNKNFGNDFFFKEYIKVFAPSAKVKTDPISNVTVVEKQDNQRRLNAYFDPLAIDSLHKKELTLFITLGDKKDTLSIRKNEDNKYKLDYAIPDKCPFVTLQVQTKNLFSSTKTIALDEDHLDLQFFPESGELVHGLPGKVGFKALDYSGKGKSIEGEIVNKEGEIVTYFKSNKLGMGSFILSKADSNTTYFAKLKSQSEEKLSLMYPLPRVAPLGNVLSITKREGQIRVTATSNYLKNDSIHLRVSCRGLSYFEIKEPLKEGARTFSLPANELPEGIIAITMMDTLMQPVAERLYFNERPEGRINIVLSTDKDTYSQRELTKLNIETRNSNGEAIKANLSLLVLNKEQMGQIQSTRQNILSYFLLSSDLKGTVENPGFYFSKDSGKDDERHNYLDALLLTQGWRKYNYTKPIGKILFQPEARLTVSGSVGGVFSQSRKKVAGLTMMTFGHSPSVQTQTTDSLGRFNFSVNDEYGQNLNILIQSANKSGQKKDYTITLDKKEPPAVSFDHIRSVEKADSVVHALVEKNIERKKADDTYRLSSGEILLKEFVIESYRMTPERKKVMDKYGKADEVIEGKDIQEKEAKWSYGLYSVLLFNFPDKVTIKRAFDGTLYARVRYGEMTLVVIDGIPARYYDYPLIPNIPPSEVKSFEIIKNAKNFTELFLEAYPGASPMDAPPWGDVIAIYTHAGKGIFGANRAVGIIKAAVPVFSAPRQFYAPKYEDLRPNDWVKPDLRALVHWEPKLTADSLGKASATFYNADIVGKMQVVAEAISEKGEIGYQEIVYDVKKRK
jgi:hypothetical protein